MRQDDNSQPLFSFGWPALMAAALEQCSLSKKKAFFFQVALATLARATRGLIFAPRMFYKPGRCIAVGCALSRGALAVPGDLMCELGVALGLLNWMGETFCGSDPSRS